mgnify:CR=1 FL=1
MPSAVERADANHVGPILSHHQRYVEFFFFLLQINGEFIDIGINVDAEMGIDVHVDGYIAVVRDVEFVVISYG